MSKEAKKGEKGPSDYDKQWDMCVTDAVVKTGGGLFIGLIAKLLFFRTRRWPLIAGPGIGLGAASALCQTKLNELTRGPPCVVPPEEREPPLRTYQKC